MGVAVIIPDVNFASANLGKVTLTDNVPVRALSIVAPSSFVGASYQLGISYYPINTNQRGVTWSIVSGSNYATVDSSTGLLSIKSSTTSAQNVVVKATSTANESVVDESTISVKYNGGVEPEPSIDADYYFPFTSNGNDVIKGIEPDIDINTTYSKDGVYFAGSDSVNAGIEYKNFGLKKTFLASFKADNVSFSYQNMILSLYTRVNNEKQYPFAFGVNPSTSKLVFIKTYNGLIDGDITIPYTKNVWNKIAVVYDGSNIKLFFNGSMIYTATSNIPSEMYILTIGNTWKVDDSLSPTNRRVFKGYIKDVYAWDEALSEEELIRLTEQ